MCLSHGNYTRKNWIVLVWVVYHFMVRGKGPDHASSLQSPAPSVWNLPQRVFNSLSSPSICPARRVSPYAVLGGDSTGGPRRRAIYPPRIPTGVRGQLRQR